MAFEKDEQETAEITMSPAKLLGLFFAVVLLCGISLAVGYNLGRSSARKELVAAPVAPAPSAAGKPGAAQLAAPSAQPAEAGAKTPECLAGDCSGAGAATAPAPAAAQPAGKQPAVAAASQPQAPASRGGMAFDQLKNKDAHPVLTLPPAQAAAPGAAQSAQAQHATLGAGYSVQIAATSNQEEARHLRDQLLQQQYPVIITQPGDKLYHVLVGPYPEIKEAELMRSRLVSAGWSTAFLKR